MLAATALFLRKPNTFYNPQFWAEDLPVFCLQQREHGWTSILTPHAGYLHLIPRLTAIIAQDLKSVGLPWFTTWPHCRPYWRHAS